MENGYADLPFPFRPPLPPLPTLFMEKRWHLAQLLGYCGTWSALAPARAALNSDPLTALAAELKPLWGDEKRPVAVRWPLRLGYFD